MQTILSSLESVASEYGMALNKTKTELIIPTQSIDHTLKFHDGSKVTTKDTIKYLDSTVPWTKPVETAFYHRAGLAEKAYYKKLRLIWNRKKQEFHIFPATLVPTLIYGLEALTPTTPHMKGINAHRIRFLRRLVGIKASYYSPIPNSRVYEVANSPKHPSETLGQQEHKMMKEVFLTLRSEVCHSVVFCSVFKDRIPCTRAYLKWGPRAVWSGWLNSVGQYCVDTTSNQYGNCIPRCLPWAKPRTPKPETLNKPQIPQTGTQNPKPKPANPKPETA